nr:hypothetical protein [Tanacetum cinerariifolium]
MASFDYRFNPLYTIKECSSCGALYTTDYCCSEGSLGDKIICDLDKTPNLSQQSPQNCPKCGNPVDGHYCQGCALLRKKFKEDLFTYCIENGILQDSSEPSNENTNVANAFQEPFVVNQDPGENSSQSPPQINHHCCYECGDPLEDIFCCQCTCELCGRGSHYGYNCPSKVPIVSNPEPCHNQNIDELPLTLPSFDPTCYSEDGNSFTYDSTSNLDHDSPNDFDPPLQPPTYSYEFCGNDAYSGHDCSLQLAFEDKHCQPEDIMELFQRLDNDVQNIHEELAMYINTLNWDRPIVCYDDDDDDEDYAIAVTPSLSTEEPDNSLNQFEDFSDSNDGSTSNDDDSFSIDNIEYVEASPPNYELVSPESSSTSLNSLLEETNTFDNSLPEFEAFCFDLEEISDGSTTTRSDISLPEYEAFYNDHVKEISSGSTTTHFDSSLYDLFIFDLSINPFPPADRSDFYELADELIHIINHQSMIVSALRLNPTRGISLWMWWRILFQ